MFLLPIPMPHIPVKKAQFPENASLIRIIFQGFEEPLFCFQSVTLGQVVWSVQGVYRVHYDPGVWLVIVGTIILGLGTVWALLVYFGLIRDPENIPETIQREAQSAKIEG